MTFRMRVALVTALIAMWSIDQARQIKARLLNSHSIRSMLKYLGRYTSKGKRRSQGSQVVSRIMRSRIMQFLARQDRSMSRYLSRYWSHGKRRMADMTTKPYRPIWQNSRGAYIGKHISFA